MNTRMGSWLALPFLLLLSGCPDGGGGGVGFESAGIQVAYVANSGSGDVSAYTINSTGALVTAGTVSLAPAAAPTSLAVSPNGSFAYVTAGNVVHAFTINTSTGALTSVAVSPYSSAGITPNAVTVSPNNNFVYVANSGSNNITAFRIGAGGALTLAPSTLSNPNPAPVGGASPNGLTVTPNGQFLYVSNGGGDVAAFSINGTSGELTGVAGSPFLAGTTPSGITVEPNGQYVYVSNGSSANVSGYRITAGTGALVSLGAAFPAGTSPSGIATPGRP